MIKNHLLAVLIGIYVFVIKKIDYLKIIYFTNPLILSMIVVRFSYLHMVITSLEALDG